MKKMTMTQWLGSIWYSCLTDSNKMVPSVEFKKIREVALNLKHSALDKLIDWLIVKWYHVCTQIVPNSVNEFFQAYSCWQICQVVVADSANSEVLPSSVLTFWQVCSCWAESAKLIVTSDWLWLWERNGLTTQMVARWVVPTWLWCDCEKRAHTAHSEMSKAHFEFGFDFETAYYS